MQNLPKGLDKLELELELKPRKPKTRTQTRTQENNCSKQEKNSIDCVFGRRPLFIHKAWEKNYECHPSWPYIAPT